MSENRTYLQDDWDDLPLPGQDESWKKMEALLDKEERRRIIPPYLLNCAGIALAVAIVGITAWLAFRPGGFFDEKNIAQVEKQGSSTQQTTVKEAGKEGILKAGPGNTEDKPVNSNSENRVTSEDKPLVSTQDEIEKGNALVSVHAGKPVVNERRTNEIKPSEKKRFAKPSPKKNDIEVSKNRYADQNAAANKTPDQKANGILPGVTLKNDNPGKSAQDQKDSATKTAITSAGDPVTKNTTASIVNTDKADTANAMPPVVSEREIKTMKPRRFSFSAGLGIQQQLRNGTQLAYSSDYYGKKGVFSEHIPSFYFRVHHKENWFAQAEFRFGAPQLVKDYSYARKIRYDTGTSNLVVSTLRLRKLYYHQLPISFNYNVLPHLSVGAGGVYSIFYRAVTEQEVKATNIYTGAETYSKFTQRVPGYSDSFFFKSQLQFILHTDYRWKNFSLGLRYKKDLQPYIKYTKPDGKIEDEMNDAVEVILRYRLWKSKR